MRRTLGTPDDPDFHRQWALSNNGANNGIASADIKAAPAWEIRTDAADVIVAGQSAVFHPAFIKIGLSGSELGVSWRLQRTIGVSKAREMLLTGRPMDAAEALRTGLIAGVVPDEGLAAHGAALAEDMLKAAPDALRISKRTFDATLETLGFEAALEIEERGQIQAIRAGARARELAAKG